MGVDCGSPNHKSKEKEGDAADGGRRWSRSFNARFDYDYEHRRKATEHEHDLLVVIRPVSFFLKGVEALKQMRGRLIDCAVLG